MGAESDAGTGPPLRPRPGRLREVGERVERLTGLRAQIMGGKPVMSPAPQGKHAGVVWKVRRQLDGVLPEGLAAFEVSSIALPDDPDDYVTPDLIVLPMEWADDDDWLADPRDCALAVEAISPSEKSREIRGQGRLVRRCPSPRSFRYRPRKGTWDLNTRPDNGAYQNVQSGKFGESVRLPRPLAGEIATDDFPLYGDTQESGRSRRHVAYKPWKSPGLSSESCDGIRHVRWS
ncbi:Uma2 family endonuclease [Streptomyces sp. NPDC053750]|uniref:Uma2 family endonuclease n=1 Tax=Streptomyces sp. NPDC053750 TaxID=3365714 RepID=UPI0037CF13C3